MNTSCQVCAHPRRTAIEGSLREALLCDNGWQRVSWAFHVAIPVLAEHAAHMDLSRTEERGIAPNVAPDATISGSSHDTDGAEPRRPAELLRCWLADWRQMDESTQARAMQLLQAELHPVDWAE